MSDSLCGCTSNTADPGDLSTNTKAEEDRLSTLPADILLHILSFLPPTKEVVRTCTLSKRWRYIWTGISEIFFRIRSDSDSVSNPKPKIIDGVSKVLAMCTNLKQFDLTVNNVVEYASCINSWLECLVIKNTVESIRLRLIALYEFPQVLFSYTSLKNLSVSGCVMNPQGDIGWICLTRLRLEWMELSDNLMGKILSGCPVLEFLSLRYVIWGLRRLNITSPRLTTLVIGDYYEGDVVEVSAPYVRNFSICMSVEKMRFRLKSLSSVVVASIDFKNLVRESDRYTSPEFILYIKEVFQSLKFAKELDLGYCCIEVLSMLEMKGWNLPPISTRLSLNLQAICHEGSIPGIIGILKSSPCLETLVIKGRDIFFYVKEGDKDLFTRDSALAYLANDNIDFGLNHLKIIKIDWFKGEQMPILVQLLLKNAKVLQKMVIKGSVEFPSDLASRLLTFPRASTEAVVIFQ